MLRTLRAGLALASAALTVATVGVGPAARATESPALRSDQVLHSFGGPDGAGPLSGVIVGPGGVLFGTTVFGGAGGGGSVFSLTPNGSGFAERVLFSFGGNDGLKPSGNVALDARGDLFGATTIGGAHGAGTVFELRPKSSGAYRERVLYDFIGSADGLEPVGTPVIDEKGNVFGVTEFGGTGGQGVIYEVSPSRMGHTERVLHSFANTGGQPQSGLTLTADGALVGTVYGFSSDDLYGKVFRLDLTKKGPVYTDVYDFRGGGDGANPIAPLVEDARTGALYGTTQYGGMQDDGTVFSLTPSASGYDERVLYTPQSGRDGVLLESPILRARGGRLFGTATIGGIGCHGIGCGIVYELVPSGAGYRFHKLYRFRGPPDGAEPEWSGLAAGPGGTFYGTTRSGGSASDCSDGGPGGVLGCGTVYAITFTTKITA